MNECKKEFVFENKNSVIWVVYFFKDFLSPTDQKYPVFRNAKLSSIRLSILKPILSSIRLSHTKSDFLFLGDRCTLMV